MRQVVENAQVLGAGAALEAAASRPRPQMGLVWETVSGELSQRPKSSCVTRPWTAAWGPGPGCLMTRDPRLGSGNSSEDKKGPIPAPEPAGRRLREGDSLILWES